MDMRHPAYAHPKPERRTTTTRRKRRQERAVTQSIRAQCVARDGYCRVSSDGVDFNCSGPSEWAHFGDHTRARTRGQDPEQRHTTAGSLMLCRFHHRQYDAGVLQIFALTTAIGCDGDVRFRHVGWPAKKTECPECGMPTRKADKP